MTLEIEYSGPLDPVSDGKIMTAALNGIGSCCLDSTYREDLGVRHFVFKLLDSNGANAMQARIQQAGVTLSRQEIAE